MKHHLLQYDPETRLWSRPDILPGHVFGQPEHALAFGHTDSRTPNPESGIWFQVSVFPGAYVEDEDRAIVEWADKAGYTFTTEVFACDAGLTIHSLINDPYHIKSRTL